MTSRDSKGAVGQYSRLS